MVYQVVQVVALIAVLAEQQVLVTPLQLRLAKEIMEAQHQVLLALVGAVLAPQEIILPRPELQLVVQAARVYLALLLAILTTGQVVVVVGYLQIIR
jgi:hypothetical protein